MEPKSKFFTQLHRNLLNLASYHKNLIIEQHKAGIKDKDDDERLRILNDIPRLVNENINSKQNFENTKMEERENLLKLRQEADCPECKTTQRVKIVKQTVNKKFGWKLDVVKCRKCKTVFTNYMPNNWSDRLKFTENLISKLFEVDKNDKTLAETLEVENILKQKEVEQFNAFKEAQLQVEAAEKKQIEAIKKADEALLSFHDFLFTAKIKGENWNLPTGIN